MEKRGFDSGERRRQCLHYVGFGAHAKGGCQGYLTGSETSGTRNLSPISKGDRIGKKREYVNSMRVSKFPTLCCAALRLL